eukprot:TRINITY_DN397_c0_g1_i10.p1 TRINITY_DN397_c0_g1~~TRINITY_DN397_c0_g1_i10.p1  ORF type:complete len:216 (+),score=47.46 TRINITY_DN397_c0_g1_i10:424-1071(+)
MTGEVPDLPEELQSKTPFEEPAAVIDSREWYADMIPVPEGLISQPKASEMIGKAGVAVAAAVDDLAVATGTAGAATAAASGAVKKVAKKVGGATVGASARAAPSSGDAPNPALYERYYPADKRNLAPHINISDANDKVGLSMNAVEAGFLRAVLPPRSALTRRRSLTSSTAAPSTLRQCRSRWRRWRASRRWRWCPRAKSKQASCRRRWGATPRL